MDKKMEKKIQIFKIVLLIFIILVGSIFIRVFNINNIDELVAIVNEHRRIAPIIYILLFTILPSFFFSVVILSICAGRLFGFVYGSIYTFIGAFLNSTLTYMISKYVAFNLINDILNKNYKQLYDKIKKNIIGVNGMVFMMIIRLLPLIPYTLVNYIAGAAGYNYKMFIIGTMIGILPGLFCYVNIGASSSNGLTRDLVIAISILLAFFCITSLIAKKYYKFEE